MRRETDTSRAGRAPAGTSVPRAVLLLLLALGASGCTDLDASVDELCLLLERHVPHTHVTEGSSLLSEAPPTPAPAVREPVSAPHFVRIRGALVAGLALAREDRPSPAVESAPAQPPQSPPASPPTLARADEHPWAHQVLRRDTHPWAYQVRSPAAVPSVAHTGWSRRHVTRPSGDGPSRVASSAPLVSSHVGQGRETLARRGRVSRASPAHPPWRTARARPARTRGRLPTELRVPVKAWGREGSVGRSTADPPASRSVPPQEGRLRVPYAWLFAA